MFSAMAINGEMEKRPAITKKQLREERIHSKGLGGQEGEPASAIRRGEAGELSAHTNNVFT